MLAVRRSRGLALATLTATAAVALAGCGSASNFLTAKNPDVGPGNHSCSCAAAPTTPQSAENGVTALLDHDALTATVTLDADPATLDAVFQADTDSPLPRGAAGKLAGATVIVAAKTGGGSFRDLAGQASLPKDASYSLTVDTRATPNLVQAVGTPTTLYARADVDQLLGLLGGTQISGLLDSPNLPVPLAKAVAGQWISIDLANLKPQAGASTPSVGPSQAAALVQSLETIFRKDVTVTRATPDPKLGDHFVLSGNARTVGSDLIAAVKGLAGSGATTAFGAIPPSTFPDRTIKIDEYVRNGTASAFRFDLVQLLNPAEAKAAAGRPAMLDIDLTPTAMITTPTNAVAVDPSALSGLSGLLGASGLGSALGSASSTP